MLSLKKIFQERLAVKGQSKVRGHALHCRPSEGHLQFKLSSREVVKEFGRLTHDASVAFTSSKEREREQGRASNYAKKRFHNPSIDMIRSYQAYTEMKSTAI